MPGGVRNRNGMVKVTTPLPKWLTTRFSGASNWISTSVLFGPPYQYARNPVGLRSTHPDWLAMTSGRHRYGWRRWALSIQSRLIGAGSIADDRSWGYSS